MLKAWRRCCSALRRPTKPEREEPVKQGIVAASIAGLGIALSPLPASAESGTLHVEKECSQFTGAAGSFCTITSSNFDAIPTGSKVVYKDAVKADGGLDTDIVINTPEGDTATGHVVLDGKTETGTVTLTGGTGKPGEPAGGPQGRPSRCPKLQLGRAVLALGTISVGKRTKREISSKIFS